jgi:LysM repeat protein
LASVEPRAEDSAESVENPLGLVKSLTDAVERARVDFLTLFWTDLIRGPTRSYRAHGVCVRIQGGKKMIRKAVFSRFQSLVLPGGVALGMALVGCKGPAYDPRGVPLSIPSAESLAPQIGDGPRTANAEREIEKQAQNAAQRIFRAEPMARELASPPASAAPVGADGAEEPPIAGATRPAWADGVEKPADAGENDLPQGWPVEVRRGETPALLAQWAGIDPQEIIVTNAEALGNRKWLRIGDRITVTMSANRKVAFDRMRDGFQKERVDAFFANKFFEKVIVYRVKKGEFIAAAAKRYGDVPLWLIEEFNQTDFRGLQPGDEILIPVVSALPVGLRQPPPLAVVDEEGHPLAEGRANQYESRIRGDFMAKARMALDDSNVFMRGGPIMSAGVNPAAAGQGFPRPEEAIAPVQVAGQPAGGYPTPPAVIGGAPAGHPLLPEVGGAGTSPYSAAYVPAQVGVQQAVVVPGPAVGDPGAEVPAAGSATPRDVVVKRGESLLHYVKWSKVNLDNIKQANPHLDPERIFVGARISIPMNDDAYVEFVKARALWEKEKEDAATSGDSAVKAKTEKVKAKTHTVKTGETATSIARAYRISVKELREANPQVKLKKLRVGSKLTIPPKKS